MPIAVIDIGMDTINGIDAISCMKNIMYRNFFCEAMDWGQRTITLSDDWKKKLTKVGVFKNMISKVLRVLSIKGIFF